jgi:hypothetical protein
MEKSLMRKASASSKTINIDAFAVLNIKYREPSDSLLSGYSRADRASDKYVTRLKKQFLSQFAHVVIDKPPERFLAAMTRLYKSHSTVQEVNDSRGIDKQVAITAAAAVGLKLEIMLRPSSECFDGSTRCLMRESGKSHVLGAY